MRRGRTLVEEERGRGFLKVQGHRLRVSYHIRILVEDARAMSWGSDDWLPGQERVEGSWRMIRAKPELDFRALGPRPPARLERQDRTRPELSVAIDWEPGRAGSGQYRGTFA